MGFPIQHLPEMVGHAGFKWKRWETYENNWGFLTEFFHEYNIFLLNGIEKFL